MYSVCLSDTYVRDHILKLYQVILEIPEQEEQQFINIQG